MNTQEATQGWKEVGVTRVTWAGRTGPWQAEGEGNDLVELGPGHGAVLEGLCAEAVVIEDLLGQKEEVVWVQTLAGPHLRHELEVQGLTHLLPGHPL